MPEKLPEIYTHGKTMINYSLIVSKNFHFGSVKRKNRESILELACGTGRIKSALAKADFNLAGIDYANGMLKEAREKSTREGIEMDWIKGDMRDFK